LGTGWPVAHLYTLQVRKRDWRWPRLCGFCRLKFGWKVLRPRQVCLSDERVHKNFRALSVSRIVGITEDGTPLHGHSCFSSMAAKAVLHHHADASDRSTAGTACHRAYSFTARSNWNVRADCIFRTRPLVLRKLYAPDRRVQTEPSSHRRDYCV